MKSEFVAERCSGVSMNKIEKVVEKIERAKVIDKKGGVLRINYPDDQRYDFIENVKISLTDHEMIVSFNAGEEKAFIDVLEDKLGVEFEQW